MGFTLSRLAGVAESHDSGNKGLRVVPNPQLVPQIFKLLYRLDIH